MKRKHGAEQAAKLIRFRLKHIREMMTVAEEDKLFEESNLREVDSLDVYYNPELFASAKKDLETWRADMPEESREYVSVESEEAVEVRSAANSYNS